VKTRLKYERFYQSIEDILINHWDPLGISDLDCPRDEYRGYVPIIYKLALEAGSREDLIEHLNRIAREVVGVETNAHNDRRAAQLIMALKKCNLDNV